MFGRRKPPSAREELRAAVAGLPPETRAAMLAGVRSGTVIAGAYADGRGGRCPVLAAHRRGVRTGGGRFPAAWDRFTGALTGPREARATDVAELAEILSESLAAESWPKQPSPVRRAERRALDLIRS